MQAYEATKFRFVLSSKKKKIFHAEEKLLFDNNEKNQHVYIMYRIIEKKEKKIFAEKMNGL